ISSGVGGGSCRASSCHRSIGAKVYADGRAPLYRPVGQRSARTARSRRPRESRARLARVWRHTGRAVDYPRHAAHARARSGFRSGPFAHLRATEGDKGNAENGTKAKALMVAFVSIPDQELIYIARGLRALARDARADAEKQESLVVKSHHLEAART